MLKKQTENRGQKTGKGALETGLVAGWRSREKLPEPRQQWRCGQKNPNPYRLGFIVAIPNMNRRSQAPNQARGLKPLREFCDQKLFPPQGAQ